jgi:hypothetical protein
MNKNSKIYTTTEKLVKFIKNIPTLEHTLISKDGYNQKTHILFELCNLSYRFVCFSFCLGFTIAGLLQTGSPWFKYLTNETHICNTLFFFLALLSSLFNLGIRLNVFDMKEKNKKRIPLQSFFYITEFLRRRFFAVSITSTLFVVVSFWLLVYSPGYTIYASTVSLHGITCLLLIIEFFVSTMHLSIFDIIGVFFAICLYEAYGLFDFIIGGVWVYSFLDVKVNGSVVITVMYFFLVPTIYCMIYIVIFFASWIRNLVSGVLKIRVLKIADEIVETDSDDEEEEIMEDGENNENDKELKEVEPIN